VHDQDGHRAGRSEMPVEQTDIARLDASRLMFAIAHDMPSLPCPFFADERKYRVLMEK
jgi:hypothetical protein